MDSSVPAPGSERWRVIVGGVGRLLRVSGEQAGLAPEVAALAARICSRLRMSEEIVLRAVSCAAHVPHDRAPLVPSHIDAAWRVLFNTLPVGVAVLPPGGAPMINMPAIEMLGLDESQAIKCVAGQTHFCHLFHADGREFSHGEHPLARLERAEEFHGPVCKLVNPKGEHIAALFSGGRADPTDLSSPFVLVGLDVTEVERLVEQARAMKDEFRKSLRDLEQDAAERLEHAREELLQVMSHEIRNPLQVMKGLLQMALLGLREESRSAVGKYLTTLESQVDALSAFMNEALQAYRDMSSIAPFRMEKLDLASLIAEALEPYAVNPNGHPVLIEAEAARGVVVRGDRQRLTTALRSLMSNAVKYSPEGARVWVKVETGDAETQIAVEDEGVGIPPDELERVFEGFYRRKDLSSWHTNGMGLGLHISRNVTRRHGGDLWAENRPGGGTTMRLRLPLYQRLDETAE